MTAEELRAAANSIIDVYINDPKTMGIIFPPTLTEQKAIKLARHILATVRDDDADRAAFEAWAKSVPAWSLSFRRRSNGDYYYESTVLAWAAWQAAKGIEVPQ